MPTLDGVSSLAIGDCDFKARHLKSGFRGCLPCLRDSQGLRLRSSRMLLVHVSGNCTTLARFRIQGSGVRFEGRLSEVTLNLKPYTLNPSEYSVHSFLASCLSYHRGAWASVTSKTRVRTLCRGRQMKSQGL